MGISERRNAEKEAIQQKIYNAAVEIIMSEGYEKLSIRKIANRIEYSPTLIYNYYKDKSAIISSIVIDVYFKVVEAVTETIEKNKNLSPEIQIRETFRTFIQIMLCEPEKFRAVISSGFNIFSDFNTEEEKGETGIEILKHLLSLGEDKGAFRKTSKDTAKLLIVALLGFVSYFVDNKIKNIEEQNSLIETYSDILLQGLLSNETVKGFNIYEKE